MTSYERMQQPCRQLIRSLADLVEDRLPAAHELQRHVEACRTCQARVTAARASAALLRRLPRLQSPAAARSAAFLTEIHERAGDSLAEQLGPFLRKALQPRRAPGDAVWVDEQGGSTELVGQVRSLPSLTAPGWLWGRIRVDLRAWRSGRRRAARRPALRIGLLAAAVSIGAFLAWWDFSPQQEGTYPVAQPVFRLVADPLDAAVSGGGWTGLGR